ncbi:glutamate receptor-like [Centruroides sculpturatus]|uniref:glutamate receptor-like n=1 Tax=Centruroides sculpturatus TaxID=218467 RepID=UPI000C6DAC07|nr:glutamate receptor-like [Centruroides sculpturatus]
MLGEKLQNGSWNGLNGRLQRKEIDFGLLSTFVNYESFQVVDYTVPFDSDEVTFVVSAPKQVSKLTTIIRPFAKEVWLMISVTSIVFGVIIHLIILKRNNIVQDNQKVWSIKEAFLFLFQTLILQGGSISHIRDTTTRIIIGIWLLASVVITSGYCGVLFSYLTLPLYEKVPNTIAELINAVMEKKYSWGSICFSPEESYLMNVENGPFKILGDHIKNHPENCFLTFEEGIEHTLNNKYAFFGPKSLIDPVTKDRGENLFVTSEDSLFNFNIAFSFKKNFGIKTEFDKIIGNLRDSGIYKKLTNDLMPPTKNVEESSYNPLSLEDMMSTFILLLIGYAISILCFICEYLKICNYKHN